MISKRFLDLNNQYPHPAEMHALGHGDHSSLSTHQDPHMDLKDPGSKKEDLSLFQEEVVEWKTLVLVMFPTTLPGGAGWITSLLHGTGDREKCLLVCQSALCRVVRGLLKGDSSSAHLS